MDPVLLIRYGVMRFVGWFQADADHYEVGDRVVIQTRRGLELGEILGIETATDVPRATAAHVLRRACMNDLARAEKAVRDRPRRLAACEAVFGEGRWPFDLLDVEPLLDDSATVLYYLGPHHLETEGLRQVFRDRFGFDVLFEPIGGDEPVEDEAEGAGCGSCGSSSGGGCGSGEGGGCGSCGVKDLVARRRAVMNR